MDGSIETAGVGITAHFGVMRQAMVTSQLRTTAVDDARLVAAMATVERERFVPFASRDLAYRDTAIPLGRGRSLNLPMATGRLLNEAYLRPEDHVLLIGAATGYSAAVLALLVRDVIAVEADATLAEMARTALATTANVQVLENAFASGHPAAAPFDVIIIDGAVEEVPTTLLEQLGVGGRIVTGTADRGMTRLASGRRGERGFGIAAFADADCVILPGFTRPRAFTF